MLHKFSINWFYTFSISAMALFAVAFIFSLISLNDASAQISDLKNVNNQIDSQNQSCILSISDYKERLNTLNADNLISLQQKEDLELKLKSLDTEIDELNSKLMKYKVDSKYPFYVPTTGVLPNFASGYGENMRGMQHFAVDIWTTIDNYGQIAGHKGNPVYSACDGKVVSFDNANGAVTIACDEIPSSYDVPAYKNIMTYYGHLGNGETKELFINVSMGQRVSKGDLIGYQGDLSKFFPEMRNVHLHFQLWSGQMEPLDGNVSGPHNPCSYIGGNCNNPGETFTVGSR